MQVDEKELHEIQKYTNEFLSYYNVKIQHAIHELSYWLQEALIDNDYMIEYSEHFYNMYKKIYDAIDEFESDGW